MVRLGADEGLKVAPGAAGDAAQKEWAAGLHALKRIAQPEEIAKAALIPALLYFGSVFWMVHLEAKRLGLRGLHRSELPNAWKVLRQGWLTLVPLVLLIVVLMFRPTGILGESLGRARV